MSEKELAERIIAEAQRWTESQFTLQGLTCQAMIRSAGMTQRLVLS
jgi:hypothetical protein